jgi:tetratricopeptide (TPR) repeat protein/tRNA A-37 threonylcarbamoyl transferase component Bud32
MPAVFNNIYRFERLLGKGGFGTVFLAREDVSNRLVAIKQLNSQDATRQAAIVHEMQMVSQFNHPNIVTYHHQFSENGLLFLVMEYCAGGSVRDALENRKVSATEALNWIQTIAEALDFVHRKKIIHHDIKPDNLLVAEHGTLKISDFGIANTGAGTRSYMSPEALSSDDNSVLDTRVDIYALGVTLMELLTGQNPFFYKTPEEIQAMHDQGDFPIKSLPRWQQEIILKAINKVPELRFQSMGDFAAAIKSKHVPLLLDKGAIRAGQAAERAERSLSTKKWSRAGSLLEFAAQKYPTNVNVLRALGRFHLMQQKIGLAKSAYEQAIKLNPRIDVQKALGWINLALKEYPVAISLLTDHLHRNPSDLEAHNLLLQCFYETDRYDVAISLARSILDIEPNNPCFANNYYIATLLHKMGQKIPPADLLGGYTNEFIDYNYSVVSESVLTHAWQKHPTLKSKLLFMDYRFRKLTRSQLFISDDPNSRRPRTAYKLIITFGREGCLVNDLQVAGSSNVSRRHCVVVNCRDDVWLYDLESTGTQVNGQRVKGKTPLIGRNIVRIGSKEFVITNDKDSLI